MMVAVGTSSCSSSSRFGPSSTFNVAHAREVAARSVQAGDKSELRPGRPPSRRRSESSWSPPLPRVPQACVIAAITATWRRTRSAAMRRQSIVLALRPAIFDRHVPALDIAGFAQALAERGEPGSVCFGRRAVQEPDHRHRRLLRARRERPRRRRAAEA